MHKELPEFGESFTAYGPLQAFGSFEEVPVEAVTVEPNPDPPSDKTQIAEADPQVMAGTSPT